MVGGGGGGGGENDSALRRILRKVPYITQVSLISAVMSELLYSLFLSIYGGF